MKNDRMLDYYWIETSLSLRSKIVRFTLRLELVIRQNGFQKIVIDFVSVVETASAILVCDYTLT